MAGLIVTVAFCIAGAAFMLYMLVNLQRESRDSAGSGKRDRK